MFEIRESTSLTFWNSTGHLNFTAEHKSLQQQKQLIFLNKIMTGEENKPERQKPLWVIMGKKQHLVLLKIWKMHYVDFYVCTLMMQIVATLKL